MAFTDDEVLTLLELDFDVAIPTRWTRLRAAAWWLTLAAGSVAAMYVVVRADYGFLPPRFAG